MELGCRERKFLSWQMVTGCRAFIGRHTEMRRVESTLWVVAATLVLSHDQRIIKIVTL